MDPYTLIGLTSPLAAGAALVLQFRISRRRRLQRRALEQSYLGIESLKAGSEAIRRRSRALLFHRTASRRVPSAVL